MLCWFGYFAASHVHQRTNNASTLAVSAFILFQRMKRPSGPFITVIVFPHLRHGEVLGAFTHQDRLNLQDGPFPSGMCTNIFFDFCNLLHILACISKMRVGQMGPFD